MVTAFLSPPSFQGGEATADFGVSNNIMRLQHIHNKASLAAYLQTLKVLKLPASRYEVLFRTLFDISDIPCGCSHLC